MRIFLLEDDPIYQDIIKEDLESAGHQVDTWGFLQGASEMINKSCYDLLCLNVSLTDSEDSVGKEVRDGAISLLRQLKNSKYPIRAVLFISIHRYELNSERIDHIQFIRDENVIRKCFRKPYYIDDFIRIINDIEYKLSFA